VLRRPKPLPRSDGRHGQPDLIHTENASSPSTTDTTESGLSIASSQITNPDVHPREERSLSRTFDAGTHAPGTPARCTGFGDRSADGWFRAHRDAKNPGTSPAAVTAFGELHTADFREYPACRRLSAFPEDIRNPTNKVEIPD
jgi:hypothetical protein